MEQHDVRGMWGRYVLFVVFAIGILVLNLWLNPPKPRQPQARQQEATQKQADEKTPLENGGEQAAAQPGEPKPGETPPTGEEPPGDQPASSEPEGPAKEPKVEIPPRAAPKPKLVTLGSLDPDSPYRALVTFTNLGAAVVRIELNSPRYGDLDDRSGYLGHLVLDEIGHLAPAEMARRRTLQGCPVDVVGPGTPAARAGLKPGDLITAVAGQPVTGYRSLRWILEQTDPRQAVQVTVLRQGKPVSLSATLRRRPLEVVRPEKGDPLSFLLTLQRVDGQVLDDLVKAYEEARENAEEQEENKKSKYADKPRDEKIGLEFEGLDLRTGPWEIEDIEEFDRPGPHTSVTFFRELPNFGLKIRKIYRLAPMPEKEQDDSNGKAYHLVLDVKIENIGRNVREVAYQLDGPTGLPMEGAWYAYKVGRGGGLRDVVVSWERGAPNVVPCGKIADDKTEIWGEQSMTYVGVDAQYFSAIMIPQKQDPYEIWFAESRPLRVGAVNKDWKKITNTSCRLISRVHTLQPGGKTLEHSYTVFAGPKKPPLLAQYGLKELVYYGWFWWVAIPMLWTLHVFYAVVGNYGLAIIMLTVLVRGCMFPLSIKQQRGARKMQELQPEIKKIQEKYKNNAEAKVRAQQELFKKHKYNPLSGCLIIFLQFPIFIGLYRGLSVDVELRQAPLFWESIRWCSNLAAPDMLYDWSWFWSRIGWTSITEGLGFFGLGPYFNLLPILTIALFLIQQKMFMPPPADEQAKMQHTMMKFMMVFMGFVFYKVASGLCLYFIASSLWGLAERRLLPKTTPPGTGEKPRPAKPQEVKPKQPEPQQPKPAPPKPSRIKSTPAKAQRPGSDNDGAVARKKKKKRSRGKR